MSDVSTDRAAIESALAYVPAWLAYQHEYRPYVGTQVAVRHDGDLLISHAEGWADLHGQVRLTTDHLFRIASHSKTFTGVAVMQLVEAGKLRLDDEVGSHVAELADSAMAGVTVRELLAHGSGMIRDGIDATFWTLDRRFPDREQLLEVIREHGKVIAPNGHFKYSNIGYSLLGLVIETASGEDYRDYVSREIVGRLGLANTGPDLPMDRLDDFAKGYSSRAHGPDRIEIEHIDTFAESAATGFYANAEDLTAYFQAHLDGDERMLTGASKRRMRQVQWKVTDESSYGLGLGIDTVHGRTYHGHGGGYPGHGGGYPGHITISRLDLERRLSISVLTNTNDGPAATLCGGILGLIDLALKKDAKTEPRDAAELERYTGRFASLWGITDIAAVGGRLYALAPSLDHPAGEAIELEEVHEDALKVVGDKGFGGYGEVMRFTRRGDGSIAEVRGASGMKLVPRDEFRLPDKVRRPS